MREIRGDWRDLFNGFSVALDFKKLLAGFIALMLTLIIAGAGPIFVASLTGASLIPKLISGEGPFCSLYCSAWSQLWQLPLGWFILTVAVMYLLLCVIWSYFGGMISRIAAINIAKDEGLESNKALAFVNKKYLAYLSPWIICVLGFLFFFTCVLMGGLVGLIPYAGELLVAIFYPLAVLAGFIMVFIAIGFIFGAPLFFPTISVEGSDSFDAMSRSFSYIYARPWHYIFYIAVAKIYGAICIAFVWLFGYFMIIASLWAGGIFMGAKLGHILSPLNLGLIKGTSAASGPVTYDIAGFILFVWLAIIIGFILAYAVSYYYSAATIIYLLLRKKVDDIDMKEVYEEEEKEEPLPAPTTPAETKPAETKPAEKPPAS